MSRKTVVTTLGLVLLFACAIGVQAATPYTDLWSLVCSGDGGYADISVCIPNTSELAAAGGLFTRTWGDPTGSNPEYYLPIGDTGAVLQWLTIEVDADPVVNLHFSVEAGATPTRFTMSSTTVSFPAIDANGMSSAGITITDTDGDGATAVGQLPSGKFYTANYNSTSSFANLITGPVAAGAYATVTASDSKDWAHIGSVSSISSQFDFLLSAHDIAGCTSVFVVEPVPEPGALLGLASGLVGLFGVRIFRKK